MRAAADMPALCGGNGFRSGIGHAVVDQHDHAVIEQFIHIVDRQAERAEAFHQDLDRTVAVDHDQQRALLGRDVIFAGRDFVAALIGLVVNMLVHANPVFCNIALQIVGPSIH
ncbi:hypothetical protein LP420_16980 [Massilia sp. B-10]|nr:hypothetical protein LP420_16980 [Massilia sp. B-10]